MIKLKLLGLLIVLRSIICGCYPDTIQTGFKKNKGEYKITAIGKMPKYLRESSGLETAGTSGLLTHVDGKGNNHLYMVSMHGVVEDTISLPQTSNVDWEDITKDSLGFVYIGDFGNNLNIRKNLRIYKVNESTGHTDTISFHFADQSEFPPDKKMMNFDLEAFFWMDGALHLFSKNRGKKCVKHYILPDGTGHYEALPIEEIYLHSEITAADISPDNKSFAMLAYGKIYLFKISNKNGLLGHPYKCIPFAKGAQAEGLVFVNNDDFLISNETGKLFLAKKIKF